MNVAGPSQVQPRGWLAHGERVGSVYEEDLLRLLGQLNLAEIEDMQGIFTRRERDGGRLSDREVALSDFLEQAHAMAVLDQDRALAQRIAAGEDVAVVDQRPVQPPRAVPQPNNTGTAARRNGNQQRGAPAARDNNASSQTWGGWVTSVMGWMFGSQRGSEPAPTNPGTAAPRPPAANRPTGHDCVICQDPIRGAEIRAPCGHYYDIGCITDLFQSATRDETLYPPRCCRQNIPFAQVRPHLTQVLITTFREKETEFSTLKRVYCSSPTCSRFLGPLSEGIFAARIFVCPAPGCGRRTCGKCRQQHSSDWTHACRPDADATQVLELSRASGWARCPGCSQMIELHLGCFHMTCRCRTEFCYLCRARWKTCRCPQWDERRLLAAAEARVDAQLGVARERVPAQRARPVPVPAPVPARQPRAPAENAWANRAQVVVPAARPPVPVPAPAPGPARRPPPPVPVHTAAPARPLAPARPPAVQLLRPQPTPSRTPTASSSTARPAHPAPTSAVTAPTRMPVNRVSTSTSASASTSVSASGSVSTSSTSAQARWRKSAPDIDTSRQLMVREMMERLRVNHECDHGRWRYRSGGGHCQSCAHHLPLYLFRCQGCEMLVCNRCRRNRL